MEVTLRRSILLVTFALLLSGLSFAQKYGVTDLGTLGGSAAAANAINSRGQITGYSSINGNSVHAFLWSSGTMQDLGTLGGTDAIGLGINASGDVVGYSELGDGAYRGFAYSGGRMITLPPLSGDYGTAYGINNSRQVIGNSKTAGGIAAGVVFFHGVNTDLGNLGGDDGTSATAINKLGQVVGYSYNTRGDFRAFLWQSGTMSDLGTLGGDWSQAYAINDVGQITGSAYLSGNFGPHAFILSNGTMVDVDKRSKLLQSAGLSINRTGIVVGKMQIPGGQFVTFDAMIVINGKMTDLNTLIAPGSGWILQEAHGINDSGQIVGLGLLNKQTRAFLLTPVQ
ncbi:MAG TPA: hypothetical protein VH437_14675 [Terriglobales bacterium]|jgi:probable HAF family extracellular repeat protein